MKRIPNKKTQNLAVQVTNLSRQRAAAAWLKLSDAEVASWSWAVILGRMFIPAEARELASVGRSIRKRLRVIRRFLGWGTCAWWLTQAGMAADSAPAALPVLTQAAQVLQLTPEQAKTGFPLQLQGVVTYADANWEIWFLQDATAGLYLHRTNTLPVLAVGDTIEVTGISEGDGFAPVVREQKIVVRGRSSLPTTRRHSFDELARESGITRGGITYHYPTKEALARVASELVNTQADVREIRRDMATKDDIKRVLNAIDAFAKKSENDDKSVALHGHVLTEVQVDLKDHEKRIKTLESTRP